MPDSIEVSGVAFHHHYGIIVVRIEKERKKMENQELRVDHTWIELNDLCDDQARIIEMMQKRMLRYREDELILSRHLSRYKDKVAKLREILV